MIAQIKSGSQFAGLVNYANDIAKKETVIVASEGYAPHPTRASRRVSRHRL